MPERPLQVAAYAAGASLAAVTLVYVFGPTFFLDDEAARSTRSSRKRGVVGLANPANDCFINSTLQCLAGLPDLRFFLAREVHLRRLAGSEVWDDTGLDSEDEDGKEGDGAKKVASGTAGEDSRRADVVAPFNNRNKRGRDDAQEWKIRSLQHGLVTVALKEMLDQLNERPIYKKTLSAQNFVQHLEAAFRTRINRTQQDAQEFLQLVTERLCDEYHAGRKARRRAMRKNRPMREAVPGRKPKPRPLLAEKPQMLSEKSIGEALHDTQAERDADEKEAKVQTDAQKPDEDAEDRGFPFEGKTESQIECTYCHFKPRPLSSSFVTLTLHVPQGGNNTSLNACFDNILKVEHIDDFICAKCRIQHALEMKQKDSASSKLGEKDRIGLEHDIAALQHCLKTDPEAPPKEVTLPDSKLAPRRRIARHSSIAIYPQILGIHLSRSMWAADTSSTKNQVKVQFPEALPLGGILQRVRYRLLGVVTHKGGHNSGHYESFRRQVLREPYSTPPGFGGKEGGIFGLAPRSSERPSPSNSRTSSAANTAAMADASIASSSLHSRPSADEARSGSSNSSPATTTPTEFSSVPPTSPSKKSEIKRKSSMTKMMEMTRLGGSKSSETGGEVERLEPVKERRKEKKKGHDRWWRISDDKIKECSTREVLKMEREVYLLFYELVPEEVA